MKVFHSQRIDFAAVIVKISKPSSVDRGGYWSAGAEIIRGLSELTVVTVGPTVVTVGSTVMTVGSTAVTVGSIVVTVGSTVVNVAPTDVLLEFCGLQSTLFKGNINIPWALIVSNVIHFQSIPIII